MITRLGGLVAFSLVLGIIGAIRAEQITSTCRITAVDTAAHTVTLVRKTATGERTGVAKVAAAVKVTIDGQAGTLTSLTLPADATVVYDTAVNAVAEIRVTQSMTPAGPTPAGKAPPLAIAPFDAAKAKEHQEAWAKYLGVPVETTNSIGMKLVLIPPGEFEMGSTQEFIGQTAEETKSQWYRDSLPAEVPKHPVRLTKPFYIGACEVTQDEFNRVMGSNPSEFTGEPRCPVEQVTWNDADDFCRRLSAARQESANRLTYRLPTEAEWEYACRAGSIKQFNFGDNPAVFAEYGWGADNSERKTHMVSQLRPNAWGLRDMHGNVWERCTDWCDAKYYSYSPRDNPPGPPADPSRVTRAIRGGSYSNVPAMCRSAYRIGAEPLNRSCDIGMRVVADVSPQ